MLGVAYWLVYVSQKIWFKHLEAFLGRLSFQNSSFSPLSRDFRSTMKDAHVPPLPFWSHYSGLLIFISFILSTSVLLAVILFLFNCIWEYGWLALLWWFQMYSKVNPVIQTHVSILLQILFPLRSLHNLNGVPFAMQEVLAGYPFQTWQWAHASSSFWWVVVCLLGGKVLCWAELFCWCPFHLSPYCREFSTPGPQILTVHSAVIVTSWSHSMLPNTHKKVALPPELRTTSFTKTRTFCLIIALEVNNSFIHSKCR